MRRDKRDALIAELRQQAEAMRLRVIETDGRILVMKLGTVVYRSSDPRDIRLYLEMQRASA